MLISWSFLRAFEKCPFQQKFIRIDKVRPKKIDGQRPFSEIKPVLLKKFIAALKGKKLTSGKNLSAKRIHNVMIPLRVIVKDAIVEYGWKDFPNPFAGVKLPKPSKTRVFPFS